MLRLALSAELPAGFARPASLPATTAAAVALHVADTAVAAVGGSKAVFGQDSLGGWFPCTRKVISEAVQLGATLGWLQPHLMQQHRRERELSSPHSPAMAALRAAAPAVPPAEDEKWQRWLEAVLTALLSPVG